MNKLYTGFVLHKNILNFDSGNKVCETITKLFDYYSRENNRSRNMTNHSRQKNLGIFINEKLVSVFLIHKIRFIYLQFLAFDQQNLTKNLKESTFPCAAAGN